MNEQDENVGPITQEQLKKYLKRKLIVEKIEGRIDKQRQGFIDRAGLGASVENGALILKIGPNPPRINATLILQEVAKRYGEAVAKEIEKLAKKDSGSKRVLVESK